MESDLKRRKVLELQKKRTYCSTASAPPQIIHKNNIPSGFRPTPKRIKLDEQKSENLSATKIHVARDKEPAPPVRVSAPLSSPTTTSRPKLQNKHSPEPNKSDKRPRDSGSSSSPAPASPKSRHKPQPKDALLAPAIKEQSDSFNIPANRLQCTLDTEKGRPGSGGARKAPTIDRKLVYRILSRVYSRTVVPNVEVLEQYKPWSPEVYGELKRALVHDIISKTELTPDCLFIDFGCGVGNVILQVAAEAGCSVYGVELNHERYKMAVSQVKVFQERMRQFEIPHGQVTIYHSDFLNCDPINLVLQKHKKIVVLVNNFMFEEETRLDLLQLFLQLDDNSQIVSLKSFRLGRHRLTGWNSGDIANILRVDDHSYGPGWVSWSSSPGKYYIATVDRSVLRKWEEGLRMGTRSTRRSIASSS